MKQIIRPILLMSFALLTINSCKKIQVDTETQSSTDNAAAEAEFVTVMPTVNNMALKDKGVQKMESVGCPIVEIVNWQDTNAVPFIPITVRILYNNCVDSSGSGAVRTGTITATFNKPWHPDTIGTNLVVINMDITTNNKRYTGTMYISKPAANSFNTVLSGGKCEWTSGKYVLLDYNKTLAQTAGTSTPNLFIDDVFEFTGTSNGVNREGRAFTVNITSPLVKRANCSHISKGTIELTPSGLATRTVDYGDGTCDNKASITINGNTFNFNMD